MKNIIDFHLYRLTPLNIHHFGWSPKLKKRFEWETEILKDPNRGIFDKFREKNVCDIISQFISFDVIAILLWPQESSHLQFGSVVPRRTSLANPVYTFSTSARTGKAKTLNLTNMIGLKLNHLGGQRRRYKMH